MKKLWEVLARFDGEDILDTIGIYSRVWAADYFAYTTALGWANITNKEVVFRKSIHNFEHTPYHWWYVPGALEVHVSPVYPFPDYPCTPLDELR